MSIMVRQTSNMFYDDGTHFYGVPTLPKRVVKGNMVIATMVHTYLGCPPSFRDSLGHVYTAQVNYRPSGTWMRLWVFTAIMKVSGKCRLLASMACGGAYNIGMIEASGVDPVAPLEAYTLYDTNDTTAPHYCGSVTPSRIGSLVIGLSAYGLGALQAVPVTPPRGVSYGLAAYHHCYWPLLSRATVTPEMNFGNGDMACYSVLLRPAQKGAPEQRIVKGAGNPLADATRTIDSVRARTATDGASFTVTLG